MKPLGHCIALAGLLTLTHWTQASPHDDASIYVQDTFSVKDEARSPYTALHRLQVEQGGGQWEVITSDKTLVISEEDQVVLAAGGTSGEARIRLNEPGDITTVSALVKPETADWLAVALFADSSGKDWFASNQQGATIWMLFKPNGHWALYSDGVKNQLLSGGPKNYPEIIYQQGKPIEIGLSYDRLNGKVYPYLKQNETEVRLFTHDDGWLSTRLPAGIEIDAAGFRINGNANTQENTDALDDFTVSQADSGMLRFNQLPENIRKQVPVGTPRKSAEIADSPFGIHTTIMHEGADSSMIERQVELMSEAGFKWAIDYHANSGVKDLTPHEVGEKFSNVSRSIKYAQLLREADINLMMRIDPLRWAPRGKEADFDYEPGSLDMQKAEVFTRQIVRQLKPYTKHWHIWNEPNIGNETPYVTPENYVKLFSQISAVIREEQPDAVVYGPGTAMLQCMADKPYPWIPRVLDAGLMEYCDVFSFHPYRQPAVRANLPEYASEFHPWTTWGSYEAQINDLKEMISDHIEDDKPIRLAATEDGVPDLINGAGEQELTWVVAAKYELRRALQDFKMGIYPRTIFCLYRNIRDPFYNEQSSYNLVTSNFQRKPAFNAAQNLNAVLDSTYQPYQGVDVSVEPTDASDNPEGDIQIQTYYKDHGEFEELLVFYWSAEEGKDVHPHYNGRLEIRDSGWEAPLEIDLMAMPVRRPSKAPVEIIDSKFIDRRDPRPLVGHVVDGGVQIKAIDVRDYPMLIKWIRVGDGKMASSSL